MRGDEGVGRIHSIQSLAASDGPGVRFAVFLQGCPLRCGCCHNPDTWDPDGGQEMTAAEIVQKAARYRAYFGREGGITVSGGEPLLQADFVRELFTLCHREGIHTCLDTSGCLLDDAVKELLSVTDRVLLDLKYTNERDYLRYVGCSMQAPLGFLAYLEEKRIPTTLRQVILPTLNDGEENARALGQIAHAHTCVEKVELLPFRKLCQVKYDNMGLEFPFGHLLEPDAETLKRLQAIVEEQKRT